MANERWDRLTDAILVRNDTGVGLCGCVSILGVGLISCERHGGCGADIYYPIGDPTFFVLEETR